MRFLLAVFLVLGLATVAQAEEEMRTWTSGTFTVEAKFVKFEDGNVVLDTGSKTIRIPEDKLSEADQEYLAEIRKQLAAELNWDFESKRALGAVEKFHTAEENAATAHDKESKKNRLDLIRALKKELKAETKAGNLEEATNIKDAIAALKKGGKPSGGASEKKTVKIPRDAVEWKGHHYKVITTPMTWHVARDHCEALGGHLARIQSPDKNAFVFRLTGQRSLSRLWIDGTDERAEGTWLFGNGKRMKFFRWTSSHGGQPDNAHEREHSLEFCQDLAGAWNDGPSSARQPFICEWDQ